MRRANKAVPSTPSSLNAPFSRSLQDCVLVGRADLTGQRTPCRRILVSARLTQMPLGPRDIRRAGPFSGLMTLALGALHERAAGGRDHPGGRTDHDKLAVNKYCAGSETPLPPASAGPASHAIRESPRWPCLLRREEFPGTELDPGRRTSRVRCPGQLSGEGRSPNTRGAEQQQCCSREELAPSDRRRG